jgi:hypothetical protein
MDKRFQVFVSSTYEDLRDERQEVMQALLELDCMPSGMELFPAADDDQWTLIKKVIDDCDYYLVIIGGRYGSTAPSGKSYTQMEYEYAVSKNKPVIAFLHQSPSSIPAGKTETREDGKKRLEEFRQLAQRKMVKFWSSSKDLGSVVSRSIVKQIKSHPAVGWVRADEPVDGQVAQEILRLKKRIEELQARLQQTSSQPPQGVEDLAQGEERYEVNFHTKFKDKELKNWTWDMSIRLTWNRICKAALPTMIDKATEFEIGTALVNETREQVSTLIKKDTLTAYAIEIRLDSDDLRVIIVQLRALGLVVKDARQRSVRDTHTYWCLTPYGDNMMTKLIALRSKVKSSA